VPLARLALKRVPTEDIVEIPVFDDDELSDAFGALETQPEDHVAPPAFPLSPFFAAVSEDAFAELLGELRIFSVAKGTTLFSQGDVGHSFFIITRGAVAVIREGEERMQLARLHAGEIFGEIAMLTNQPRSATVEIAEDAELIEVHRGSMSRLVFEDEAVMPVLLWFLRERLVDTLVRTSPIFRVVPPDERRALASSFSFIEVREPTVLIEQGQSPRGVIVALAGTASVVRSFGDEVIPLGTLGAGDVCGEMSILTHEPALATVRAEAGFIGLEMSREKVERLITERPALLEMLSRIAERRRVAFVETLERGTPNDTHLPLV
jgi:cAMP-dependent protein kinase regulator